MDTGVSQTFGQGIALENGGRECLIGVRASPGGP
jgi:hypothetical protein